MERTPIPVGGWIISVSLLLLISALLYTIVLTFVDDILWNHADATLLSKFGILMTLYIFSLTMTVRLKRSALYGFALLSLYQLTQIITGQFEQSIPMALQVQLGFLAVYLGSAIYLYRLHVRGVLR